MNTLDRHLTGQFARNALLVSIAMVVVFLVLDVLLNFHLLTRQAPSPWLKLELFLCHVPSLLNFALPVAAVVAALACAAPMLRRGEFTALGAAGITLQHATRMLLVCCLVAGVVDAVIADLASPPTTARALAIQDQLEGQSREGRVWRSDDGVVWFAGGTKLVGVAQPELQRVVVASGERLALADRLRWDGRAWQAPEGLTALRIEAGAQHLERIPPGPLPASLPLALSPPELYRRLLPRYTMTSLQLLARGERADHTVMWSRWSRALYPVLAAMVALAVFVRFRNRDRVAVATIEAVALALLPTAILATGGMAADSAPGPAGMVQAIAAGLAVVPAVWLWGRWRL